MNGLATAADNTNHSSRGSNGQTKVRNRSGDNRTHPDHGPATDFQIAANDATRSDCGPFADNRRQGVFIRIGSTKLLQVRRCGSRKSIIRKDRPRADHHAIFDRDPVADVGVGVNLDSIANTDLVRNQRFATDKTLFAQSRVPTNMRVIPDRTAFADLNIRLNHGGWMNSRHVHTFIDETEKSTCLNRSTVTVLKWTTDGWPERWKFLCETGWQEEPDAISLIALPRRPFQ